MAAEHSHEMGLAGRYALAIFDLAQEEKAVDAVAADFAMLKQLMAESPELTRLIRAPVFSREEQAAGMNGVMHRMEASALTRRFILLLASKRRLFALSDIIRAYDGLVAKLRGEVSAEVTSARPLSDQEVGDLKAILKSKLSREIRLDAKVDASLLGGLVVKVGSRMIDSSIRTKLNGMRIAMRGQLGKCYHISGYELVSIRQVVEMILDRLGRRFEDCVEVGPERPSKDTAYTLDSFRLRSELGWRDVLSLRDGIDDVIDWAERFKDALPHLPAKYEHKP